MLLRYEQLAAHLRKPLAPLYLVSGDVPLLVQEASTAIRNSAAQQGYSERTLLQVETGFNWHSLTGAAATLSLFSDKQLLELRLNNNSPGDAGSKALQAYAERPPPDKILLIIMGKLDAASQRTVWFQALLKAGIVLQLWPIENAQLPRWIAQRLTTLGLQAEPAGIQLLAERSEGNLLAVQQAIDKLQLLHSDSNGNGNGNKLLSAEDIAQALADSARFDVFALTDAALQGDSKRTLRIITNLHEEGVEPTLVLWALSRELRALATQAYALTCGTPLEMILQQQRVWEKRKPWVRSALQRHSVTTLRRLLQYASHLDHMIKGLELGNVWDTLSDLALALATGQAPVPINLVKVNSKS